MHDDKPAPPHDAPAVPRWLAWAIMVGLGLAIWLIDLALNARPDQIEPWGWRLLAIFVPTILGLMLRPLPGGALVLLAVTLTLVFQALPPPTDTLDESKQAEHYFRKALAGYANSSVWMMLAAYFMARALIKTGLARRVALTFVRLLGGNTLGLSYALVATDTVLAAVIPSNAARVGGVVLPITRSLAELYKSFPGARAGLLGTFLMIVVYQADVVNCALFLTGQASNPLAADEARIATDGAVKLTYPLWTLYALAPALVSLLLVPYLTYRLCKPGITHTPEATEMAKTELAALGPSSRREKLMIAVFAGVCLGWVTSIVSPTLVAMIGAGVLFLSGVLTWDDAVSEKGAWDVFIWYGGLVQLGYLLNEARVTKVFAEAVAGSLQGLSLPLLFGIVLLIYFYAHYGFASITTHIVSMYKVFVGVLLVLGAPPWLAACSFAYFTNLCAGLTHYGTTPAPIIFGTGYVAPGTWWRIGFLLSLVNIVIWLGVGLPWWKLWGLW
jgi:divalent anion:Na+ symporter, DASS family